MLEALKSLGFHFHADPKNNSIVIQGEAGRIPVKSANLKVGNAGTVARFLTAFLAIETSGTYTLDGDPAMRTRPIQGLLKALTESVLPLLNSMKNRVISPSRSMPKVTKGELLRSMHLPVVKFCLLC